MTPSRVEQDLEGRTFSVPILLVNHEDEPRRITLSVSGLAHDLDGNPLFLEPAPATDNIELSISEVVLEPEERQDFVAEGQIPEGKRSIYAAVVAEFAPLDAPPAPNVESRTRVASLFLFRGPRPWKETAKVVDVSILPAPENKKRAPLTVYAAVEDTGNVHIRPTGRMRILQEGRLLDTVQLEGQTILPTYARRLVGQWKPKRKLDGRIDLKVRVFDPDAKGSGFVDFAKGEIRRPAVTIGNLVARFEGGPLVEFVLTNTGTIPLGPDIKISASTEDELVEERSFTQAEMEPGAQELIQWRPELEAGVYLIEAEATFEEQVLARAATGLKIEKEGLPLWMIILGGVLLLLLVALVLFLLSRRRKRSRDEEAPDEESPEAA